jgi:acyl dehydratase
MRSLDEFEVGDTATMRRTIRSEDVQAFESLSGDLNPIHHDPDFARRTEMGEPIVYGALLASFVSALIGNEIPGAGALWADQSFRWTAPVHVGDTIEITLTVTRVAVSVRSIAMGLRATN